MESIPSSVLCECGCGRVIERKRHHRYRLPRFIAGHNPKAGPDGRHGPAPLTPPDDVILLLTGICGCGCGRKTSIARQSRPRWFQYAGYPLRFRPGHHTRLLRAEQTSRWSGGRSIDGHGYVRLYRPTHPNADSLGFVKEHRLVVSTLLGRRLDRWEHVHHKNGDRQDNRPENLELLLQDLHPIGQRAEDLLAWSLDLLERYGDLLTPAQAGRLAAVALRISPTRAVS